MKIYVITGAASGIGNALSKAFAKDNIVFAGFRNPEHEEDLKVVSKNIIPFFIDLQKPSSIRQAAAFIKSRTDKIDVLINAAGIVAAGAVENIETQKIMEQFQVNTFSHLDFSQRLLERLNGGKIINISSMSSFGIFPFISPYSASKRALDILFNAINLETKSNVKVVSVKPGVIATPLWKKSVSQNKKLLKHDKVYEKEMNFLAQNALKNGSKGLNVNKVVDLILKIDKTTNPKASYTIGMDAKLAEIVSKLPQDCINTIVKYNLNRRLKTTNL